MRVHVHRQVEAFAQSRDELRRGRGAKKTRHVLDREDVRAGCRDAVGEAQVVVERVQLLRGVEQIGGVADGHLGHRGARLEDCADRGQHLVDVVEGVEDAEDVDTGRRRLPHEGIGDGGRPRRIADGVPPAQQHLDRDVRHRIAEGFESLPRVLGEESQGDVVRRPAPRLHRQQLRRHARDVRADPHEVARAHARREQGLVRVPVRRLGDGQGGLCAQGLSEARGAEFAQHVAVAARYRRLQIDRRQLASRRNRQRLLAVRAVHRHIREPVQQLRRAVARGVLREQLGTLVDERRRQVAGDERRVIQHGTQERDVRRDAADTELREGSAGAGDGGGEVATATRELREHRVEVRADLRSGGGRATVEADAGPTR